MQVHLPSCLLLSMLWTTSGSLCKSNQVSIDGQCLCLSGYFCPTGEEPTSCPAGYTSNLGATNLNECYVARGSLVNLTVDFVALNTTETMFIRRLPSGVGLISYEDELLIYVDNCPTGYWCGDQSGVPTACPAGTYQPELGAENADACLPCPVGHFCAAATTNPANCPGGTYGGSQGLSPGECSTCDPGGYCPSGSSSVIPVPAGFYISFSGATSLDDAVDCPQGRFCLQGATEPLPCPAGTYLSTTGGTNVTDCITCPTGAYCGVGSIQPTECANGSYNSQTGEGSSASCLTCPSGAYCLAGSSSPVPCGEGTYSGIPGAVNSSSCIICPGGYFCVSGSSTPTACEAGTSRSTPGGTQASSCDECPQGFYCPAASVEPSACGPGTYSNASGATTQQTCLLCLPGTFSLDTARASICPACNATMYCPTSTSIFPCPPHTSSLEGAFSIAGCLCEEGYDCVTKKEIHATVRVNATATDFNSDAGGVRSAFIAAVAEAASVTVDKVTILGVSESRRRRLLSYPHTKVVVPPKDKFAETMRIHSALTQALHLKNIRKRMPTPLVRNNNVKEIHKNVLKVHHRSKK